jgi:hypothetical protein
MPDFILVSDINTNESRFLRVNKLWINFASELSAGKVKHGTDLLSQKE